MAELVSAYADLPLGSVDASVVATAERLQATTLFTLDRRHFTVVRPNPATAFTLLPSPWQAATTTCSAPLSGAIVRDASAKRAAAEIFAEISWESLSRAIAFSSSASNQR